LAVIAKDSLGLATKSLKQVINNTYFVALNFFDVIGKPNKFC
jgi:hypothetical protein